MSKQSLESKVKELYLSGKTESEIAKELHVSLKYVHGALKILGLIN